MRQIIRQLYLSQRSAARALDEAEADGRGGDGRHRRSSLAQQDLYSLPWRGGVACRAEETEGHTTIYSGATASGSGPQDPPDTRHTPKMLACVINKSGRRNRFLTLKINVVSCHFRYNQVHRIKSGDAKRGQQNMEGISNKTQHKTQYTQQNKNITEPF